MNKYVMVTAISTHRVKYCIPIDELKKMDPTRDISRIECELAEDSVALEEVKEFSQNHIGESIIESRIVDEKEMLRQFDEENENLINSWTKKQKIKSVRNWKSKWV